VGNGTLTVTYNGTTSAPAPILVVPSALGFNFYNGNLGVATDAASGALLTFADSGYPGQNIVLWATGLGSNPADSDTVFATTPHSVLTPLQINIGGVEAKVLYQGSSGYPGVNQINVTVPASVPAGCRVPLVGITGNVSSNIVTLPINPGAGACIDPVTGINGSQVSQSDLRAGALYVAKADVPGSDGSRTVSAGAGAVFAQSTGLVDTGTTSLASPGACLTSSQVSAEPLRAAAYTPLAAGAIAISGPSGLDVALGLQFGSTKGQYQANFPDGAIPLSGGTFTFHGSGGADVGPFTAAVEFSNP
jgi:hypothetical protein